MKFRNVSPLGDLDVAGVGIVTHGETFEVDASAAERIADDTENFQAIDEKRPTPPVKPSEG